MKKIMAVILAIGMILSLAACGGNGTDGGNTSGGEDSSEEIQTEGEKKTVALVPPAMISPYYKSVISGAQEACDNLGYELKTLAPESESDYASQVQIVEDMITQKVDGIILCAINSDAIVAAVKKANEINVTIRQYHVQSTTVFLLPCFLAYPAPTKANNMEGIIPKVVS